MKLKMMCFMLKYITMNTRQADIVYHQVRKHYIYHASHYYMVSVIVTSLLNITHLYLGVKLEKN